VLAVVAGALYTLTIRDLDAYNRYTARRDELSREQVEEGYIRVDVKRYRERKPWLTWSPVAEAVHSGGVTQMFYAHYVGALPRSSMSTSIPPPFSMTTGTSFLENNMHHMVRTG